MKYKKILIATILLLAILTVGAVSASEDADVLAQDSNVLAQDADILAQDSDVSAQDADVLAQDSDEIVGQGNAIDDKVSNFDDELEGNFSFTLDPISTTSGGTTFATLNLEEAAEGIILITTEDESLLFEKDLSVGDFNQNSYNILVRDVDFDNLDNGPQFLNFRFYDSNHNQVIHEYYQVDYNKNANMLVLGPAIYLEIYDGLIEDYSDDPIIVVYAPLMQLGNYALTIGDEDYTWGYYPDDLYGLTLSPNGGIYTKNHMEGWFYYGISAARLEYIGLNSSLDGKTLDISVRKSNHGSYGDIMAQEERTITFEYGGFYLEEDVINPTLILEVYGTEYYKISYDNGDAFAIIVSGDERTGKWLPVDKLIPVRLRVLSDDGEIEFLNVTLGSLDYTAVPYSMGIIEHFFTLSDVNDFTGLNDGDIIRFGLTVPPFPESYMYYTIHFDDDGIVLTYGNGEDAGEAYFNVSDKVFKDEGYEQVFGIDVTQDQLNNELGSGIVEVTSDDGQTIFRSDELYEMYFVDDDEGRLIHWFTLGELSYFSDLENGDIIYLTLWQYDGAVDPWIQKRYRVMFDDIYIYLEEYEDAGDEAVTIFENANMADNDVIVVIDPSYLSLNLSNEWGVSIDVNVWGHEQMTIWNGFDLDENENGCYEFTVNQLNLNKIMQDISSDADCDIEVIVFGDGDGVYSRGQSLLYTNPYVSVGDVVPDEDEGVIIFTDFSRIESIGCDDEFTITSTSDNGSITKTFYISQMEQYWLSDEDGGGCYVLFLEDLGITQDGTYDVSIEFKYDYGTKSIYYNSTIDVVPFGIYVGYGEDKSEFIVDDISLAIFGIVLPADTTNRARIYVNGTKVLDKSLSEIGVSFTPIGREFAILLNDLQITESGEYNVKLEVLDENNHLLRNVSTYISVFTHSNLIKFDDILYIDGDYVDSWLGTPIAQAGDIVLFLNGQMAGVGRFVEVLGFDFELDDAFLDDYGNILPGHYEAQAIWMSSNGNQTIGEGSFNVFNDSGTVDVAYYTIPDWDNPDMDVLWISISAPDPGNNSELYRLAIYIDPESTNDFPVLEWEGDMPEGLWNGGSEIELDSLAPGLHRVIVIYGAIPDELDFDEMDYYSSIVEIDTGNPTELINTTLTASKVTTTYNSGNKVVATLKDAEGNAISGAKVNVELGDVTKILTTNINGKVSLTTTGLLPGTYTAVFTFDGDDDYAASSANAQVVINKIVPILTIEDIIVPYNSSSVVVATLTDENGNVISGVNVKIVVDSLSKTAKTDANGQVSLDISGLEIGEYTISSRSGVTAIYDAARTSATATITKIIPILEIPDVEFEYGNPGAAVVATLKDSAGNVVSGVKVKLVVGDLSKIARTDANGQVSMDISSLEIGEYTVSSRTGVTDIYGEAKASATATIGKITPILEIPDVEFEYGNSGAAVVATLRDPAGNVVSGVKVKLVVGGLSKTARTDANGQVSMDISSLEIGEYTVSSRTGVTDLYGEAKASATATIGKITPILEIPDVVTVNAPGAAVVATLKDSAGNVVSGVKVKLVVGGLSKIARTDANGQVSMDISGLEIGEYTVSSRTGVTDLYNEAKATAKVTIVDKLNATLEIPDVEFEYGAPSAAVVATLKDSNGDIVSGVKVKIVVGNLSKIARTDANGQISMDISSLGVGEYKISARSGITDIYNEAKTTATATITKIAPKLTIPNAVAVHNVEGNVVATLKDAAGNAISDLKVKIVVGSLSKIARTDANGQVSMDISSLAPGEYKISARTAVTDLYDEAKTTATAIVSEDKVDTTLEIPNVEIQQGNGAAVATLKDAYGNIVSGVKVKIVVGSLSKIARTDANGQVSIDISSLAPGEYKISARSAVTEIYNEAKTSANAIISAN